MVDQQFTLDNLHSVNLNQKITERDRAGSNRGIFLLQIALNIVRTLNNQEKIDLLFISNSGNAIKSSAVFSIKTGNYVQLCVDSYSFILDNYGNTDKFWNFIILLNKLINQTKICKVTTSWITTHNLHLYPYFENSCFSFPRTNLGIEYLLRDDNEDKEGPIKLEYLIALMNKYEFDDMTIKGIKELIDE